jgi:hypothetical protein
VSTRVVGQNIDTVCTNLKLLEPQTMKYYVKSIFFKLECWQLVFFLQNHGSHQYLGGDVTPSIVVLNDDNQLILLTKITSVVGKSIVGFTGYRFL